MECIHTHKRTHFVLFVYSYLICARIFVWFVYSCLICAFVWQRWNIGWNRGKISPNVPSLPHKYTKKIQIKHICIHTDAHAHAHLFYLCIFVLFVHLCGREGTLDEIEAIFQRVLEMQPSHFDATYAYGYVCVCVCVYVHVCLIYNTI